MAQADTRLWPPLFGLAAFLLVILGIETVFSGGIPRDQLEAVAWGREWVSVSTKHPVGSGWIHYLWLLIAGNSSLSGHALPVINLAVSVSLWLVLIRRLGFRGQTAAILWLTFASANTYLLAIKYNANSATLPFWLLAMLGLWVGASERRLWGWALAGVAAGFAMLVKYHTAMLLFAGFLWLVGSPEGRATWRTSGPWLALGLFLGVLLPHVWDLWRWNWPGLGYGAENLTEGAGLLGHLTSPLAYMALQFLYAGPGLWVALWHARRARSVPLDERGRFLLWFGLVFPLSPALVGLLTGGELGEIWGIGTASLSVAFLIHWRPFAAPAAKAGMLIYGIAVLVLLIAQPWREQEYPIAEAQRQILAALSPQEAEALAFVLGNDRETQGSTWYLPSRPRHVFATDAATQPWTARALEPGDLVLIEAEADAIGSDHEAIREIRIDIPADTSLRKHSRAFSRTYTLARVR